MIEHEMLEARVPPQDIEAEAATLGSILLNPRVIADVAQIVQPEDFYRQSHRLIFEAMLGLLRSGEGIDNVTVAAALEASGNLNRVGGRVFIAMLAEAVPTAANAAHYAKLVSEKATRRRLIEAGATVVAAGWNEEVDTDQAVSEAQAAVFSVGRSQKRGGFTPLAVGIDDLAVRYTEREEGGLVGLASGFPDLDNLTGGFEGGDMIVLAARPSIGKTSFALNVAHELVSRGRGVAIFSLEMGAQQLVERIVAAAAQVDSQRLRMGMLSSGEFDRMSHTFARLEPLKLFIDDTPALTELDLMTRTRAICAQAQIDLLMIDYLQLVRPSKPTKNMVADYTRISAAVKSIAREANIPVLALSQLNRNLEHRPDKRPMLADLRETGALEQDADIVLGLYRHEKYHPGEKVGEAELIVLKQRRGPTATVFLNFFERYTQFASRARRSMADSFRGDDE